MLMYLKVHTIHTFFFTYVDFVAQSLLDYYFYREDIAPLFPDPIQDKVVKIDKLVRETAVTKIHEAISSDRPDWTALYSLLSSFVGVDVLESNIFRTVLLLSVDASLQTRNSLSCGMIYRSVF